MTVGRRARSERVARIVVRGVASAVVLTLLLVSSRSAEAAITFRDAESAGAGTSAITFVGAGAQTVTSSTTSLTPALPSGVQQGDILIAITVSRRNGQPTWSYPGGWTVLGVRYRDIDSNADLTIETRWKIAGPSESGPTIDISSASNGWSAQIAAYRGVDAATPEDVTEVTSDRSAATTWTPPSITTVTDGALVVSAVATSDENSLGIQTAQGFTGRMTGGGYDTPVGSDHAVGLADKTQATAGGVTMLTWDQNANASDSWVGITFALRPVSSLTIAKPTGTVQNDVMIATIAIRPHTATISEPSGWVLVRRMDNANANANSLAVYRKLAGPSEPASYTWTLSSHTGATGGIQTFVGVDPTTPIDVDNGQNTPNGTAHATPSVTTTVANTMLVTSHGVSNPGPDHWTPPTGMTEAFDDYGGMQAVSGHYVPQAAAGPTGAKQATSAVADVGNAHILALRPYDPCVAVPDATYVAATAPSGTGIVTLYWSSADAVIVVRKQGSGLSLTEKPANGTAYTAGTQPWGAGATMPWVVFDGINAMSGVTCTATGCTDTGRTNGTTYYYAVFPKVGTCYAAGTGAEISVTPQAGPHPAWSYTLAGGPMLKAGIAGEGTVHTASNASALLSVNTVDGTPTWAPLPTNDVVQSWLTWLPGASATAGWYNASWTARKRIRIDRTKVGSGGVTDFPLLISLTDTALKAKAQASGNDILFTAADGTTKLSHEIARYTSATGELIGWVKVPSISSSVDTDLYMYYGNLAAANQQNASDVWTNGYVGVWHVKEDPAGAAPQSRDSTANANHGTSSGMLVTDQVTGKIDGSLNFDGVNNYVSAGTGAALSITGALTVEAWINLNVDQGSMPAFARVVDKWWGTSGGYGLFFDSANSAIGLNTANGSTQDNVTAAFTFTPGTWHHVVGTWSPNPGAKVVYIDGGERANAVSTNATIQTSGQAVGFGGTGGGSWLNGRIDEVRVSNVARSAAWIATSYNNQHSPSTFSSVGAENASGVVIGADQSGRVYSVDTATWTTTWIADFSASVDFFQATPAAQLRAFADAAFQAAYAEDVFFIASRNAGDTNCGSGSSTTNNKIGALRASDGAVLWSFNAGCTEAQMDWIVGMPYVDYARNRLYVTSRAGAAGTQTSLWGFDTLTGTRLTPPAPLTLGHIEASPTLSADGSTLYVGNLAGTLYAVNADTLAIKWSLALGTAVKGFVWEDWGVPGRLYFSTGSDVRCVQDNGASGSACAGWTVSPIPGASTILLLDKIYVGSSDGKVHQVVPTGATAGVDEKQFPAATTLDGSQVGDVSTETGAELFVGTAAGKLYKIPLPLP